MKILFIGEGVADYTVNILNKLHRQPNVEVFNVVDKGGGHVPRGVRQTYEGVVFNVLELTGTVICRYSDSNFWSFLNLEKNLRELRPDIVSVSLKYLRAFTDPSIEAVLRELKIRLITNDNPRNIEPYGERRANILTGRRDFDYTPWYVMYFLSLCEKCGVKDTQPIQKMLLNVLGFTGILSLARRRKILLQKLEETKKILNIPHAHISYTERAYDLYESYGVSKEKIFIKYNSPDTDILFAIREQIEREVPILPPNPHRLIHLGRLAPYKRTELLIEALGIVKKEYKNAELLIVGQGPEESRLRDLAEKIGVSDSVHFSGWVDQRAMGRYLLASSIYILGGNGGLSINDAMAFGKPVICSVADGTEKHLVFEGHNGMYFMSGDSSDLASKIIYLFAHPEMLEEMGKNSTQIIKEKVNIHTTISAYLDTFNYALDGSR